MPPGATEVQGGVLPRVGANDGHAKVAVPRSSTVRPCLLTMRQAAGYLAVSYWTVRNWVEAGKLRAVRLPGGGRLLRIEITELDRLIDDCRDG